MVTSPPINLKGAIKEVQSHCTTEHKQPRVQVHSQRITTYEQPTVQSHCTIVAQFNTTFVAYLKFSLY